MKKLSYTGIVFILISLLSITQAQAKWVDKSNNLPSDDGSDMLVKVAIVGLVVWGISAMASDEDSLDAPNMLDGAKPSESNVHITPVVIPNANHGIDALGFEFNKKF